MRLALITKGCALTMASLAFAACSHSHERTVYPRTEVPTADQQRRIDEQRAADRRAEERKADERRETERWREDQQRKADERAADRRDADRRAAERRDDRVTDQRRSIGGGPDESAIRATPSSALSSIATARCDREVRCKNIGAREKYKTRGDCVADLTRDRRDDLNSDVCRGGIREKELNDCLQSIRDEDCGNPLDAISRLNACRTGNLCVK